MINQTHLHSYSFEERQFTTWLKTTKGAALMAQEHQQLALLMPKAFGHYSVYLGLNAKLSSSLTSPIKTAISLTATSELDGDAVMDPHQLPLATEAIDLLVLQHVLDMSNNPHQVLREVARVMTSGGRLIITGLNPYSFWGLWRQLRLKKGVPWRANFLSQRRLKDWLRLLSFDDFEIKPVYHYCPDKWQAKPLLKYIMNPCCTGYVLLAVKQETRVHLVKPKWRTQVMKPKFGLATIARQPSCNKHPVESS